MRPAQNNRTVQKTKSATLCPLSGCAAQTSLFVMTHKELIQRYLTLTREVMPRMARTSGTCWPVRDDHCFQRIVLDHVCGGIWYDHLERPAYKHLDADQASRAVGLCEDIIAGHADLAALNNRSLAWRGKPQRRRS